MIDSGWFLETNHTVLLIKILASIKPRSLMHNLQRNFIFPDSAQHWAGDLFGKPLKNLDEFLMLSTFISFLGCLCTMQLQTVCTQPGVVVWQVPQHDCRLGLSLQGWNQNILELADKSFTKEYWCLWFSRFYIKLPYPLQDGTLDSATFSSASTWQLRRNIRQQKWYEGADWRNFDPHNPLSFTVLIPLSRAMSNTSYCKTKSMVTLKGSYKAVTVLPVSLKQSRNLNLRRFRAFLPCPIAWGKQIGWSWLCPGDDVSVLGLNWSCCPSHTSRTQSTTHFQRFEGSLTFRKSILSHAMWKWRFGTCSDMLQNGKTWVPAILLNWSCRPRLAPSPPPSSRKYRYLKVC